MALLVYSPQKEATVWHNAFHSADPALDIRVWPDCGELADIDYVAAWQPPEGLLQTLPNLKAIFNLGAGIDRLLADESLPDVPIVRLTDAGMGQQMVEYVVYGALHYYRQFDLAHSDQQNGRWQPSLYTGPRDFHVGILGLGVLGSQCAQALQSWGFALSGWSQSAKNIDGVKSYAGEDALEAFLSQPDVIINLLPSTHATRQLLNTQRFAQMAQGAALINIGRGDVLDVPALVTALDSDHLRGAMLDVFEREPLPLDSPLWQHPKVVITPHIAAATMVQDSVNQIVDNIHRMARGETPLGLVDRQKGY